MDWKTIAIMLVLVTGVPLGLKLAKTWVDQHVKNEALKQWADGALSAAGKAYVLMMQLRQTDPTTPLNQLAATAARQTATAFLSDYAQTAAQIGAGPAEANSRVLGQLGAMLAADPTVSVAAKAPAASAPAA